jgi:pimeloyl-ACP methyl ester carboxylesterase
MGAIRTRECTMSRGIASFLGTVLLLGVGAAAAQPSSHAGPYEAYYGNYRAPDGHLIGIDRYITEDSAEDVALLSDYSSGIVRRLYPVSDTELVMGPGFAVQEPAELRVRFVRAGGMVTGASLQWTGRAASVAERVPLIAQQVLVNSGQVKLAATLLIPAGSGPHPAIVLLHGSGPLTRYSFGPYPHFFTSLGFAVLIYDKRGTGGSTGVRLDASSGAMEPPLPSAYYPEDLVNDALAVFHFLQAHNEIDPRQIGLWGSSEGGMLATQLAARNKDVAFAINSSGFVGPLWQTLLYQAGAVPRSFGAPDAVVAQAQELARLWVTVARTGEGYPQFISKREQARRQFGPTILTWSGGQFSSLEQMRWDWNHILAFNSLPALSGVRCPVLGVFGEQDPLTDARDASRALQAALSRSGNTDVTVKVFANAGHSLAELPSGSRMAPGVFDTLRSWLLGHVRIPVRKANQVASAT